MSQKRRTHLCISQPFRYSHQGCNRLRGMLQKMHKELRVPVSSELKEKL